MPVPDERLQQIIKGKDVEQALRSCSEHGYVECWAIVDGALVIYAEGAAPAWLQPVLDQRDEDGNTEIKGVVPQFSRAAAAA